jgi:hypothetical protein
MLFWNKIIKAIPFLLQVILVIVAVALFAFWDPFGIFVPTKLKLKDTPVDVRSIREIGQLITAEYYGEVIGSYAHEVEERQDTAMALYRQQMIEYFEYYVQEINELKIQYDSNELKRRDIYKAFEANFNQENNDPYFETMLYYISNNKSIKAKQLDDRLKNRQKRNLIRNAVINGFSPNPSDANEYLKGLFSVYESVKSKEKAKKLKKHNLVMLGRGWVKAGFDFGTFSERNFRYDQDRNSIYFIGFKPQILSATINPWFVPEKGIEGFEFLIVERRVKRDYKVVQQVKQRCLDELVRKAHEREILLKSVENARESLKEFFSLLIGEEVQNVVFYDNELDFTYSEIIKNDTITGEELLLIDHVLNKQELQGIDPEDLVQEKSVFIDSLRQTKARLVIFNGQEYPRWSPELTVAYAVSRDGTYDEIEDGQMIVNFATRYCSLDTLIEAFQYTCTNQIDNNQLIIDNTNFFIARNTAAMIAVDGAYNKSLDSLFTTDNFFAGLSAAKSDNPDAYRKLISDNIITACKRCENN